MGESISNEEVLFNLLEELYNLNHRQWQNRIMYTLLDREHASYMIIKEKFEEVPDLLVYRCLRELIAEGLIIKEGEKGKIQYSFTPEGKMLAPILVQVQK